MVNKEMYCLIGEPWYLFPPASSFHAKLSQLVAGCCVSLNRQMWPWCQSFHSTVFKKANEDVSQTVKQILQRNKYMWWPTGFKEIRGSNKTDILFCCVPFFMPIILMGHFHTSVFLWHFSCKLKQFLYGPQKKMFFSLPPTSYALFYLFKHISLDPVHSPTFLMKAQN